MAMDFVGLSQVMVRLLHLSRRSKRVIQVGADIILLSVSFALAMFLRLESLDFLSDPQVWVLLLFVTPPTILFFIVLGFYRAIVRFVDEAAMRTVFKGVFASSVLMLVMTVAFDLPVPRSVPFIYMLIALVAIGGVRLAMRATYHQSQSRRKVPVIIYGAGASGRQLMASLKRGPEYVPVAFVDDADHLHGSDVEGIRIYNPAELPRLIEHSKAKTLLLALPSLTRAQRKVVLDRLDQLPVRLRTVPGVADLVSGKAEVADLREIAIEDLLGRDPVPPDANLLGANIRGKVVMVTGAGGSIGAELCRQILHLGPQKLILFEISEYMLYEINHKLQQIITSQHLKAKVVPLLGSVCDRDRMQSVLRQWQVKTLYHAAAYKHVPMVELNIIEGIRNNCFGTAIAAEASVAEGVEAFILISTDKAVRPTNVMGASKRIAELICQAWAIRQEKTKFSMVRFGNVLGSSGSVIPQFRRQIAKGGPITVTHPEINRYFMTIPEAAQLVIQAGALAKGGDVFVLDMGPPVRIVELAQRMARLYGLRPVVLPEGAQGGGVIDGDIAIIFSGLRPGEKMYEELIIGSDAMPTAHPRIQTAQEFYLKWDDLGTVLRDLERACQRQSVADVRNILISAGTGYVGLGTPQPDRRK